MIEAIKNIEKHFTVTNAKDVLKKASVGLTPVQQFFFFRSIAAQSIVGIHAVYALDVTQKIETDAKTLTDLLTFYARRHQKVITGTRYPNYKIADSILQKQASDNKYISKICNQSKKLYSSSQWFWSDFCFPKSHIPSEVETSNAMAWSVFFNGRSMPKTKDGMWTYSFAAGLKTANQSKRGSWRTNTGNPTLVNRDWSFKWLNNVTDHERERQIISSNRLTFKKTRSTARSKYLTEAHVNKEWYIRHFNLSITKPSIESEPQPFLIPELVAPMDWVQLIIMFYLSSGLYANINNDEQMKLLNPLHIPYAKKIPNLYTPDTIVEKLISNGKLIFKIYNATEIWK